MMIVCLVSSIDQSWRLGVVDGWMGSFCMNWRQKPKNSLFIVHVMSQLRDICVTQISCCVRSSGVVHFIESHRQLVSIKEQFSRLRPFDIGGRRVCIDVNSSLFVNDIRNYKTTNNKQ